MSDRYADFVRGGIGGALAKRLGLPRPPRLRRFRTGDPLLGGTVLVLGAGADADAVAAHFLDAGLDVRRRTPKSKVAAVIAVLTDIHEPSDTGAVALELPAAIRALAPNGRFVTMSRAAATHDEPALAAAREGIEGLMRSAAHEMRGGSTANGIALGEGASATSTSALGALHFFCSAKSVFVDGQMLRVDSESGSMPADENLPLAGRVAVVTGAARGIGASIARALRRDGAELILVDVPAAGDALARMTNEVGGIAVQLDITAADAGERILAAAAARHGKLDIVVHNAGIMRDKMIANMTPDRWNAVIAVNITAQLRMNEAFMASDLFRDAPRIVSLSSTSGVAGNRGQTNYGTSKAGVIGMARATAPLLASVGGTVNAVAPGFIETDMTAQIPPLTRQIARRVNSLQQGGLTTDVAEVVAFLASPQAGGIVGQTLRVCGQNSVGR